MDVLAVDLRITIGRGWTPVGRLRDRSDDTTARETGGRERDR